ncbi:MAG: propionyl-CoA synthetase [Paracoccaceae bacterium]|jgi:propionyl-CoA synthetase
MTDDYRQWRANPTKFWRDQAQCIDWFTPPNTILAESPDGSTSWFEDGVMNSCYLALDHHVDNGRGQQTALIYDSPVTKQSRCYSFLELRDETAKVAGMLGDLGVRKGDTVIIYMPMIPQAAMAMLACARIGAVHSVVFGGFAAPELASRIDDAKPSVILAASCGIEVDRIIEYKPLIDCAIELAEFKPSHTIVLQRDQAVALLDKSIDRDWDTCVGQAQPVAPVALRGDDPLYILYTSGTTGKPKGVVRQNGGHAVALKYSMDAVYGMQQGGVFWSASDVGWVVGHSYIVYGPLIHGCTTIMYEGKPIMTPDAGAFWRVIEQYSVNAIFSAPTAFRAIRREDPNAELLSKYDISSLRTVFAAGERLDPATQDWMSDKLSVPIIDNWWQTETGWPIAANLMGREPLAIKNGSATKPVPGFDIQILDDDGQPVAHGIQGNIAIKLPLPPCCLSTVWGDHQCFLDSYLSDYSGFYTSGDGGYFDQDGYLFVMGRVDDVINIAGHRLSTGDIEEVIARHPDVAECAVVAMNDELKGQLPVGFVVLNSSVDSTSDRGIEAELTQLVRQSIGPIACYRRSYVVSRLPKTRSGKVLRKVLKAMLNGEDVLLPPTIDDVLSLDEIKKVLL